MKRLGVYRKIIEKTDEALALLDLNGCYVMQSEQHKTTFGFSDAFLLGQTPALCWGKAAFQELLTALQEKGTYSGEGTIQGDREGDRRYILTGFAILDDQGKAEGYLLWHRPAVKDIPDEAELRLAASVMGHRLKGMMICDLEGRIQLVNPAFIRMTGYTREALTGKTTEALYSGHQGENYHTRLWASLRKAGQWQGELWIRRKEGGLFPAAVEFSAIQDSEGEITHYVGLLSDITEREISEERLLYLGHHDILTHLPNRRLLNDRLAQAVKQAERKAEKLAVLHIDLDHYKPVREALGMAKGDQLLIEVGQRLKNCVRDADTVARIAHDTFIILLAESSEIEHTATIAQKILHLLSSPIVLEDTPVRMSGSIGISLYPVDGRTPDVLLSRAEAAMRRVKNAGRNAYRFFSEEMGEKALARIALKMDIQGALEKKEFQVHYQPQIDLKSRKVVCMEALVRWRHPEKGLIGPEAFIPMAEETSLILPLGEWVLRTACWQLKRWRESGFPDLRMAVNLSAMQFQQESLPDLVSEVLQETGLDPAALELEITESMALAQIEKGIATMNRLERLGVRLSLDDFGIGFSSLGYLRRFPIHTLKVDQSYIQGLNTTPDGNAITAAIIAMAQNLNLEVIAEGVETQAQLDFLRAHRCDSMQGYYFSRPLPPEGLETLLVSGHSYSA